MSVEYRNSILWRGEDPLKARFNPAVDKTKKVVRYFPGQRPDWAKEEKADPEEEARAKKQKEAEARSSGRRRRRDTAAAAVVVEDAGSSRLKRLAASSGAAESSSERLLRHRRLHDARVLEAAQEEEQDELVEKKEEIKGLKDEEDMDVREPVAELKLPMHDEISGDDADGDTLRSLRRERARELALARRKQEEEMLKEEELEDEIEQEEEESEEESEDEEDLRRSALLKPVFVSKVQRETVREREAQEAEEEAARQREEEKKVERKAESKGLLVDTIRAEQAAEEAALNDINENSEGEMLDDDDEANEAEEYELWKIRELKRIKRDKEERLERQKEMEMIERRRGMTDAEREADDKRLDQDHPKREDAKQFNFLQKYYHRGGFFQDKAETGEEPLYNRDYHEPTAEETFDKTALPKAMQLRRGQFGKKGQVKHSHLTDVDTTDFSAAWSQRNKEMQKYQTRMATAGGVNDFSRPSQRSLDE